MRAEIRIAKKDFLHSLQRAVQRYIGMRAIVVGIKMDVTNYRIEIGYVRTRYFKAINTIRGEIVRKPIGWTRVNVRNGRYYLETKFRSYKKVKK